MAKVSWKPGNMLYPLPAVLVSCGNKAGKTNFLTVAWTGTICSDPAMAYISVRPERYSYDLIRESGEFVLNLPDRKLVNATDLAGVRSGRDTDKWKLCGLTPGKAETLLYAPVIEEAPVSIECKVTEILPLGSHDMFLAKVTSVRAEESHMDEKGRFDLNSCGLFAYSHGEYRALGEALGSFGFSVKKDRSRS